MSRRFNVFRDGFVHVQARMCESCIYRESSPLMEVPIKRQAVAAGTGVVCHSTLDPRPKANAICAGFFAVDRTPLLELAERMGAIRRVKV